MPATSAATAVRARHSRGRVAPTRARTGSPGAPRARRASAMLNAGISAIASPSSMSSVAANSGTVQATRKASVSLPAPNSRASDWSRTRPSSEPAMDSDAVTSAALARKLPEADAEAAGSAAPSPALTAARAGGTVAAPSVSGPGVCEGTTVIAPWPPRRAPAPRPGAGPYARRGPAPTMPRAPCRRRSARSRDRRCLRT